MAETITVSVRLFATLKRHLPQGSNGSTTLTLARGATVLDVVDALHIPRDHAGMVVSDDASVELTTPLMDGQEVSIFPPLAGGA